MKITPQKTSILPENVGAKSLKKASNLPSEDKKTSDVQKEQDSIKINESELAKNTKKINKTIGELQIAIKSMEKMSSPSKDLEKSIKKFQDNSPYNSDESIQKANDFKNEISQILKTSTFGGENVFAKNYTRLDSDIKFDASSIKPDKIKFEDPQSASDFIENLKKQQKYAKEAINLLSEKFEVNLDKLKKTNSKYEKLDRKALQEEEFKNAHNTEGITLERLTKLLG